VIIVVGILVNVTLSKHAQWGNARLKMLGGSIWPNYNTPFGEPDCDPEELRHELKRAELAVKTQGKEGEDPSTDQEGDPLDVDDLVGGDDSDSEGESSAKDEGTAEEDEDFGDLLDDDEEEEAAKATPEML
jgi:hypothetical protein